MVAAFLCGAFFGVLVYKARITAHNQRGLAQTLPPSEPDWSEYTRAWDELSNEALVNFENTLPSAQVIPGLSDSSSMDTAFGPLAPFTMTMKECVPIHIQPDVELPFIPSHSGCCNGKD
ncbi:MAG TPA: hypothetical protein VM537_10740 [Anaerolineae bacterium]|nr:hypothetical protein [Anaerolineae bacterium]